MSWDSKQFNLHLATRRFGRACIFLDEVDSTNRWLQERESDFPMTGAVAIADHQTAGRGRRERMWIDEPGGALLFSVLVRHTINPDAGAILSLVPAVALARTLADKAPTGLSIQLKWPNDLLLNGKKAAGVLIQSTVSQSRQTSVLGIGVNVGATRAQLDRLKLPDATSWLAETGQSLSREVLLADLLLQIESAYDDFLGEKFESLRSDWERFGPPKGARLTRRENGNVVTGDFQGLGARGELLLLDPEGNLKTVLTGDIVA